MSLMWPLQEALVARWTADTGVSAIVGNRIYDGMAPTGAELPYIRVGSKTEVGMHVLGHDGWQDTITADAFTSSAYPEPASDAPLLALVKAMKAALKTGPLTLTGFGSASLKQEFVTTLVEQDGKIRHAPVRYRIYAVETA